MCLKTHRHIPNWSLHHASVAASVGKYRMNGIAALDVHLLSTVSHPHRYEIRITDCFFTQDYVFGKSPPRYFLPNLFQVIFCCLFTALVIIYSVFKPACFTNLSNNRVSCCLRTLFTDEDFCANVYQFFNLLVFFSKLLQTFKTFFLTFFICLLRLYGTTVIFLVCGSLQQNKLTLLSLIQLTLSIIILLRYHIILQQLCRPNSFVIVC